MKHPPKELDPPPAHPVKWLGRLKDGRRVIITTKLWYTAREALCQRFGVSHDSVLDVHQVSDDYVLEPEQQGIGCDLRGD